MQPKRSKYDTNPLDEKVADRASESFPSQGDPETTQLGGETTRIESNETSRARSESEGRSRAPWNPASPLSCCVPVLPGGRGYLGPRGGQHRPHGGQGVDPPFAEHVVVVHAAAALNRVAGLGIQERWANLLPYVPGYVGAVAAVIELLLVPRTEGRTRFHAAQGLALQIAILILSGAFGMLTLISGSKFGSGMFRAAAFVFLIVSMVRAFKGRPHHIAPLDGVTRWLEEKIKPRK